MGFLIFLIFAVIASLIITIISKQIEKKKHNERIIRIPETINNYTYTTEEDYKQELIMQIRKLNANIVELQILQEEQKEIQKSIKEDVGLLTFIIAIFIILKIIISFISAGAGYSILQNIF